MPDRELIDIVLEVGVVAPLEQLSRSIHPFLVKASQNIGFIAPTIIISDGPIRRSVAF